MTYTTTVRLETIENRLIALLELLTRPCVLLLVVVFAAHWWMPYAVKAFVWWIAPIVRALI